MTELKINITSTETLLRFINKFKHFEKNSIDILSNKAILKEIKSEAKTVFKSELQSIKTNINDAKLGAAALDVPDIENLTEMENAFWGVVASIAITLNIFKPIDDKINGTPFSLYNSSKENQDKLINAGLKFYKPDEKIGFHTDGTLHENAMSIPKFLMLYNIFLGYKKPGCLFWIPYQNWKEFNYFVKTFGVGKHYSLRPTPIVYKNSLGETIITGKNPLKVPVFNRDLCGNILMLLNGDNTDIKSNSLFDELKNSLHNCNNKLFIPQKTKRMIFLNNHLGCHARQVFEEPIHTNSYTRSMLRSVSIESHLCQ